MANEEVEYTTLSAEDRLVLARDALRGRESDHFRLSLTDESVEPTRNPRLSQLGNEIQRIRKVVEKLEKEAK